MQALEPGSFTPCGLLDGKSRGPQGFEKETEQSEGKRSPNFTTQPAVMDSLAGSLPLPFLTKASPPEVRELFCLDSNLNNDYPGIKNKKQSRSAL